METLKVKKSAAEKWQEVIKQWEASGSKNATTWCREHAVAYESFILWRSRFKDAAQAKPGTTRASFVELKDQSLLSSGIEIHHRSLALILRKDFDSTTLLRCLQVLEKI